MTDVWDQARATATESLSEPWQARAVAIAVETVSGLGVEWDDFRRELITAIGDAPHRPYYESWLVALERLVARHDAEALSGLDQRRALAASYRVGRDIEVFPLALDSTPTEELLGAHSAGGVRHVEMHRRSSDAGREWRLCAFDGAGTLVVDRRLGLDEWDELRRRYLDLPPDPADHASG